MFSSHSVLVLSLVSTLTSAGVLPIVSPALDRRQITEDICGTSGFANSANSYFTSSDGSLATFAGCSGRCAQDPTRCKSFGYNGTTCLLYEKTLSTSLAQWEASDIVYFDATCLAEGETDGAAAPPNLTVTPSRPMSTVGPIPTGTGAPSFLSSLPLPTQSTPPAVPIVDDTVKPHEHEHEHKHGKEHYPRAKLQTSDLPPSFTQITLSKYSTIQGPLSTFTPDPAPEAATQVGHATVGGLHGSSVFPHPTTCTCTTTGPKPTAVVPGNGKGHPCSGVWAFDADKKTWSWFPGFGGFPRPTGVPEGDCFPKTSRGFGFGRP